MDPMLPNDPLTATPSVELLPIESASERYDRLRDEVRALAQSGDYELALPIAETAHELARTLGDERRLAMARLNLAVISLFTGRAGEHVSDLRRVLMRNYDAETSFIAAYNLCLAYELKKEYKKMLFYARIARDRAEASGNDAYLASSHNQMGNGFTAESFFGDAIDHYRRALGLSRADLDLVTVPVRFNLGYCEILVGDWRRGFGRLFACLRWLRRHPMAEYQAQTHLALSVGYLEIGRVEHAWRHGRRALAHAERSGKVDTIKAALFQMGEIERTGGDLEAAYDYFSQVQQRFYPDQPDAPALLAGVSMAKVVNLWA
ncbi:MAG: hypothetical protein AAGE94_01570 [Acidobacteriota bacterium]